MIGLWTAQVVHLAAGVVFAGGQVLWWVGVWPCLLALPAPEARRWMGALGPRVGAVLGGSALVSIATGAWRAWAYGAADLRLVVASLALTLAAMAHGRRAGPRLARALFDGDQWHPHARRRVVVTGAIALGCVAGVVGAMAALRLGI